MGKLLKAKKVQLRSYQLQANALKANILTYFYKKSENKLYYLIDNIGNVAQYQEGLGI